MELKITSERDNALLKRKEIMFAITHEASTPSKAEILQEVCKKLSLNPDGTIVVNVEQHFGSKSSDGVAHSYASRKEMEAAESRHVLKRAGIAPEEKKPEAKKEAPKAEEKKEEKAEDKK